MLRFDTTMMSSLDPSFQVTENEMDHGQVRLSLVRIAAERQQVMAISELRKSGIACPSISAHDSSKRDILFDKAGKHFGAPIGNNAEPQPPCIDASSVLLAILLARPNLNGADDKSFMMNTASLAARLAADKAFVNFYWMLSANLITLGTDHASAQLVENLEGGFITSQSKLALKLNGRLTRCRRGHEVRSPKPRRKWCVARLHDSPGRERRIDLADTTAKHHRRARCEAIWLTDKPALRARKPTWPTDGFKVASARRIVGKDPLKLGKRGRETANVHVSEHSRARALCQATG